MIFTLFVLFVVANLSTASPVRNQRQIPCTHPLRISRPELFTHCDCSNYEWGEWEIVEGSTRSVPTSQCPSGEIYSERREKSTVEDSCNEIETRRVCAPDASDKLIMALGLGGSGRDYDPVELVIPDQNPAPRSRPSNKNSNTIIISHSLKSGPIQTNPTPQHCPRRGRNPQVCQHLTGKRSLDMYAEEFSPNNDKHTVEVDPILSNNENPIMQFSWEQHSHRFRRQIRQCGSDDEQHVLFVLDSSGSIGRGDFNRMKTAIANLTTLFCKRVKFGLVTFSSNIHLDFCFNCFQNTFQGRVDASNAIKAANYQSRSTRTGDTAKCICEEILRPTCGIASSPDCLDVVFITDGQSNGRRQVCDEIRCLHHRLGVNTYAIGIGSGVDQREIDCIKDPDVSDRLSSFQFNNFNDFEAAIRSIGTRIEEDAFHPTSPSYYSCAALNGQVDRNGGLTSK